MRSTRGPWAALLGLVAVGWVLTGDAIRACAQPARPTPEQQKTLEQVCLARARSELLARIGALVLRDGVTVGDWLARDADLDRALRLWVRTRPAAGRPRLYSDAVGEVDVRVTPAELESELLNLADEYPAAARAARVDAGTLRSAAGRWPILWATGRAAVAGTTRSAQPPGWEDVEPGEVELARAAAVADAHHALLTAAGRLKISSARRLYEFLESSAAVRQAVQTELQRVARLKVEFAPDQVALVEARVSMRDLLRIVTRVCEEHCDGDEFAAADFREMVLLSREDELSAAGLATPPGAAARRSRYEPIELDVPDWTDTALSAIGRIEPSDEEAADDTALEQAARLDGIAQLGRQVESLTIQPGVTVGEFLGYHQELKDDVVLFLSGARVVSAPRPSSADGIEVTVELPLRRLWEILRRRMKLEEVEPPATAPAVPPTAAYWRPAVPRSGSAVAWGWPESVSLPA
jgi:hypothetical protein